MSHKNSLLVISQAFPPEKGGNASRIHDLTRFMTDEWDVTVVAPAKCYPHGEYDFTWQRHQRENIDGVEVHRLWAWQPTDPDPSFVSRIAYYVTFAIHAFLWSAFNIRDTDVMMTSSPPLFTGFVASPFAKVLDIPWVLDIRDVWIDVSVSFGFISEGGLAERLSKAYRKWEFGVASLVTVTTAGTVDILDDEYDITAPVAVIPNGVDVDSFKPRDKSDPDGPVLIYTGTIGHAQALEVCVEAIDNLTNPDLTFQIVGDGDLREILEQKATDLGIEDRVEFTGFVSREQVPGMLSQATIGIAPIKTDDSLRYAVPTKLYEYMACALPVIAVGEGAIEQFVDASDAGVVAEDDPEAIAAHIDTLLSDQEWRQELGTNGRTHVVDHYDRQVIALEFSDRLSTLIDQESTRTDQPPA
ncbi:glycosyltransferase [Halorubrum sp. CBA1125]|uniref:glycosyltransferase family 4 protein n=1 Tax=Halorubrum sp. CBA1125 TaxID=2668072 RepID=UPI0012E8821B|nr:glycosyltransferase family 4 protein [Halorubrum sp. CBA1125]MUW13230.1 glycosyltransferase [Halorubrum sp. CBA1125]